MSSSFHTLGDKCINGTVLLMIVIISNYTTNTLNKDIQQWLDANTMSKWFIVWLIIYSSIILTQEDNELRPIQNVGLSLLVWILYAMFTQLTCSFAMVALVLVAGIVVLNEIHRYHVSNKGNSDDDSDIVTTKRTLYYTIWGVVVSGIIYRYYHHML